MTNDFWIQYSLGFESQHIFFVIILLTITVYPLYGVINVLAHWINSEISACLYLHLFFCLRGMDTPDRFSTILQGIQLFMTSNLHSCISIPFWKGVYPKRKELAFTRSTNSFLIDKTKFRKGSKLIWSELPPLVVYQCHLKFGGGVCCCFFVLFFFFFFFLCLFVCLFCCCCFFNFLITEYKRKYLHIKGWCPHFMWFDLLTCLVADCS